MDPEITYTIEAGIQSFLSSSECHDLAIADVIVTSPSSFLKKRDSAHYYWPLYVDSWHARISRAVAAGFSHRVSQGEIINNVFLKTKMVS